MGGEHKIHTWRGDIKHPGWMGGGGGEFWISFFNYLLSLSDAEKTNRIEMCF